VYIIKVRKSCACVLASWINLRFVFFAKLGGFSPVV
jgi:hypothetical protein